MFSKFFRIIPAFKGKKRIAKLFLSSSGRDSAIYVSGKFGLKYFVPNTIETVGADLLIDGVYESETIERIVSLCSEDAIVFDVGANIGAICLPVAKRIKGVVYAFEPSRMSFAYLNKNTIENNLQNISIHDSAVHSIDNVEVDFFAVDEKYGHSSLAPTYDGHESYLVKTVTVDTFCDHNKIDKIDVLKIDVQGFEMDVLKGCEIMLKRKKIKNIIFEFEGWAEESNEKVGLSQEFIKQHGYDIFTLSDKKVEGIIQVGSEMLWAKLPDKRAPTLLDKFSKTKLGIFILNKKHKLKYRSTADFWEKHYLENKNSGDGSYGQQAQYKADIINQFITSHNIKNVVEVGSGDGNQLKYLKIPKYVGLDVSKTIIEKCQALFEKDSNKQFLFYDPKLLNDYNLSAELVMSLDVIYHLISDDEFVLYMNFLFDTSSKFVIIYSWEGNTGQRQHVKHREFRSWINENKKDWVQLEHIPSTNYENFCDFYIYSKK